LPVSRRLFLYGNQTLAIHKCRYQLAPRPVGHGQLGYGRYGDATKTEFLFYPTLDAIDAGAAEGVLLQYVGEMCGIKKTAVLIQPCAESHSLALNRAGRLGGDQIAEYADVFVDMVSAIGGLI